MYKLKRSIGENKGREAGIHLMGLGGLVGDLHYKLNYEWSSRIIQL